MNSSELKVDLKKQCTYGTAFLLFIINWKCQSGKENVNIDKKYSNHGKDMQIMLKRNASSATAELLFHF